MERQKRSGKKEGLEIMRQPRLNKAWLAWAVGIILLFAIWAPAQQILRNGFEGREPVWIKGFADANFQEILHETTDLVARTGQRSEHLQLNAEQGSYIYYLYPTQRAPLTDDLSLRVWVRSTRPGLQLLGRLVLPLERNPKKPDEPLTTLLRGDQYQNVSRWQPLELRQPINIAREQQQLLRLEMKRDINFSGAYIDCIYLNVYGGPGRSEVWIDDLEIGPVDEAPAQASSPERSLAPSNSSGGSPSLTTRPGDSHPPVTGRRPAVIEMNQNHVMVSGRPFLIRAIRHSDTDLSALRDAGFNTIYVDAATPSQLVEKAADLGFWIIPALNVSRPDAPSTSAESLTKDINKFILNDALLCWDLGAGLTEDKKDKDALNRAARAIRSVDPQRPLTADVWDGFADYSLTLDLMGVHRWPLLTTLELSDYREWLDQRRRLNRPGAFMWTWVQTHLPDWFTQMAYQKPGSATFEEPIGPEPEQIRLLTYIALSAGYRGLGFWSDRFLADSHQGRDRLLTLALLNQELLLLEPILQSAKDPIWRPTSNPEVKAAIFHTDRGILILPIWMGKGAQFVPSQSTTPKLSIIVPGAPLGTQPWQITPVEVRSLEQERVVGGTRVTIPEFSLTTAILFTADNSPTGVLVYFQDRVRHQREIAAQWAKDLAQIELAKVMRVNEEIEAAGHPQPDGAELIQKARSYFEKCLQAWENHDYRKTYQEADYVMRSLRVLMRSHWTKAIEGLSTPVASPYAVSFYTLPTHWRFMDAVHGATFASNVLPGGDFELGPESVPHNWSPQETTIDKVTLESRRVMDQPKEGRRCLMLKVTPQNPEAVPQALERTFLAINTPAVRLTPGTLVQISGWMRIPKPILASPDGALLFDSAGGEPLGVRLARATGWTKFTLYRRVPDSGLISVTLALTGIGTVYFDDIRIEPEVPSAPYVQTAGK
jgi:hypothetical protein